MGDMTELQHEAALEQRGEDDVPNQVDKVHPIIESFRGHKVLTLNPGHKYPFRFGKVKARMIIENIEQIRRFANAKDDRTT